MNIYVGNLSSTATENDLLRLFAPYGQVISAKIIRDLETGGSRGFGFVQLSSKNDGDLAIAQLHGVKFMGRDIYVVEAKPKADDDAGKRGYTGKGTYGQRNADYE